MVAIGESQEGDRGKKNQTEDRFRKKLLQCGIGGISRREDGQNARGTDRENQINQANDVPSLSHRKEILAYMKSFDFKEEERITQSALRMLN